MYKSAQRRRPPSHVFIRIHFILIHKIPLACREFAHLLARSPALFLLFQAQTVQLCVEGARRARGVGRQEAKSRFHTRFDFLC